MPQYLAHLCILRHYSNSTCVTHLILLINCVCGYLCFYVLIVSVFFFLLLNLLSSVTSGKVLNLCFIYAPLYFCSKMLFPIDIGNRSLGDRTYSSEVYWSSFRLRLTLDTLIPGVSIIAFCLLLVLKRKQYLNGRLLGNNILFSYNKCWLPAGCDNII